AGGAELRVEPSDRLEAGFAERHVAARNVFGLTVTQEDVNGPARRARDALGDGPVARRGEVRPSHRRVRRGEERGRKVGEPVRVRVGVVVDVGDDLATRLSEARVARA